MVKVGEKIPDMQLQAYQNDEIKDIKLSDFRGKWLVLAFYPADFTFVCPTELRDLASLYSRFAEEGAEIASVSTDTVFVHKAWHDTSPVIKNVSFPMIADPTGKLCREFGTYLEDEGVSLRATFIVDPDGVLISAEIHDNSIGRNAHEILRKLQAARYVSEHEGEVCPSNWVPGSETLHPSLDLVGKI